MTPLARCWLDAIDLPEIQADLEAVYAFIEASVTSRGPACWASGRCCKFEEVGHRLYVTGLEAAYAMRFAPGERLTLGALESATARGGCPYQVVRLCEARAARPAGCRVYFCDRTAQDWQRDLAERACQAIKSLHERHAVEYRYGEWRAMLREFIDGSEDEGCEAAPDPPLVREEPHPSRAVYG